MTQNPALDKSSTVLVVEPQSSIRMLLTDSIRSLEFKIVKGFATGREALDFLQDHPVAWIIMAAMPGGEVNCLQILKIITMHPGLKHVLCSLILEGDSDKNYLTQAFELGLFSFHERSYSADSVKREFLDLVTLLRVSHWDRTMVSAEFIRGWLKSRNYRKSLLAFDENMLHQYMGAPKILLNYAESQFINRREDAALKTIRQALVLNPNLASLCEKLKFRFTGDKNIFEGGEGPQKPANLMEIHLCLVIDPDTDYLQYTKELLEGVGVEKCKTFERGDEAWEWLRSHRGRNPDFIFLEWKIPGVSGIQLVQRIRSELQMPEVCLIVLSSLVEKSEIPLLKEIGVNSVLRKPFESADFFKNLTFTVQQNKLPTEQYSLENKIRSLLESGKSEEARRMLAIYLADSQIRAADKCYMQAEYEYHRENYGRTVELAGNALKLGKKDDPRTLNLIGKCLLKQKVFDGALKFFDQANRLCPLHVERLVNISLAHSELNNKEAAGEAIGQAKNIDAQSPQVLLQESRVHLENGEPEKCQEVMKHLASCTQIISDMNSRAVALARGGRFDEAIMLYENTVKAIPPEKLRDKNSVRYNLALAHARYGNLQEIGQIITQLESPHPELAKKARSLSEKAEQCLKNNTRLELSSAEEVKIMDTQSPGEEPGIDYRTYEVKKFRRLQDLIPVREMLSAIDIRPGDIGCHLLYRSIEGHHPDCAKLLEKSPSFNLNQREEEDKESKLENSSIGSNPIL